MTAAREPTIAAADPLPARPLRADARRNAERVLAGARVAVAELGLVASYHDIARAAGVGVATVYRRFPDRSQLFEAVLQDILDELNTAAERALRRDDSWSGFTDFFSTLALRFAENAGLSDSLEQRGGMQVAAARRKLLDHIAHLVERAQRDGGLRTDLRWQDVTVLAASVPTAGQCFLDVETTPRHVQQCIFILTDGLRRHHVLP